MTGPELPGGGRRVLVAGWFSFAGMAATAGDILAKEVVEGWLDEAGMPYDVAVDPSMGQGVGWMQVEPHAYTHLIFVCGPFYARRRLLRLLHALPHRLRSRLLPLAAAARRGGVLRVELVLELLLLRFDHCRKIGVNLSMLGAPSAWQPFDALIERDRAGCPGRADLVFAHPGCDVPVVGVILAERQHEYAGSTQGLARRAVEDLLGRHEVAMVRIDTRLDRPNPGGLRTPAEVESLVARMDLVVTTRMHGAVLALKHGVPAVVIDPVGGGAKVTSQMKVLGWPHVFDSADLDPRALEAAFQACRTAEARAEAARAGLRGAQLALDLRDEVLGSLG